MSDQNTNSKSQQSLLQYSFRAEVARASDAIYDSQRPQEIAKKLMSSKLKKTQVRNLESVAYTTDKISDITDLIKKLTGRDPKNERWGKDNAGTMLIAELEALREKAKGCHERLSNMYPDAIEPDQLRLVHLAFCREFVKHLAAHYLFLRRDQED
jgi:hypothetical protein